MLKIIYVTAFTFVTAVAGVMFVYTVAASCPTAAALSAVALAVGSGWLGWFGGSRQVDRMRESLHYDVMHSADLMDTMINYNKLKARVHRVYQARAARINRTGPQKVIGKYRMVERALP